jgi:hypothetical protein
MLARLSGASAQREFEQELYSDVPTKEAIFSKGVEWEEGVS